MEIEEFDAVVVGAGMAGLTSAARLSQANKRVLLVEKSPRVGGSAALSGGVLWRPRSKQLFRTVDPDGSPELADELLARYDRSLEFVRDMGVFVGPRIDDVLGYGAGHVIDVLRLFRACTLAIESAGGAVVVDSEVRRIVMKDGAVVGCIVADRDGETEVATRNIVLSTGGFQADPELRKKHLGASGSELLLRSNPHSDGGGLRLGLAVGGCLTENMDGFYGHLIAQPLSSFGEADFVRLSQLYSTSAIVVGRDGRRITDESLSYARTAQAAARLNDPIVAVVFDQSIQNDILERPAAGVPELERIDRFKEAAEAGAHTATAPTIDELVGTLVGWGFDGEATRNTILEFNELVGPAPERLSPERTWHRQPLNTGPFYAVCAQPAITFTFGGLSIDRSARVQSVAGEPIPGLYAAGADGSGAMTHGYGGGLAMASVFGLNAAESILRTGDR